MLLQIAAAEWLTQTVEVPLWGFLAALVLPVAYIARLIRTAIESKWPTGAADE